MSKELQASKTDERFQRMQLREKKKKKSHQYFNVAAWRILGTIHLQAAT